MQEKGYLIPESNYSSIILFDLRVGYNNMGKSLISCFF